MLSNIHSIFVFGYSFLPALSLHSGTRLAHELKRDSLDVYKRQAQPVLGEYDRGRPDVSGGLPLDGHRPRGGPDDHGSGVQFPGRRPERRAGSQAVQIGGIFCGTE